jgi:hypothetical protein
MRSQLHIGLLKASKSTLESKRVFIALFYAFQRRRKKCFYHFSQNFSLQQLAVENGALKATKALRRTVFCTYETDAKTVRLKALKAINLHIYGSLSLNFTGLSSHGQLFYSAGVWV